MDTTKLTMLLEKAKSSGITIAEIPEKNHPLDKESYIINNISVEKEIEDKLLETIKKIPEFSIFYGKFFNCGFFALRIELGQIIKWLLYNTYRYGVENTLVLCL